MLHSLKFSREINLLLLSTLLFGIAIGIDLVTFPTVLTLQNINPARIGLASTCEMFGGIVASFFLSYFISKLGMIRGLGTPAGLYATSFKLRFLPNIFNNL